MTSHWIGAAIGALAVVGLAATAQAAPAGLTRSATVAGEKTPLVTEAHGRHWRRHKHRHYGHRHYRPRYYYGGSYYRHYRPRYYAPRYYGYYGYRRPGFSIWF